MKIYAFSKRCAREILRDPLNLLFGLGFPVVLLLLLSAIQKGVPVELFEISALAPGVSVFGLSFVTLFSATLVARDRENAFLQRLYTAPLSSADFILGYMIPIIPISVAQAAVSYLVAILIGLEVGFNIVFALLFIVPTSLFYIALGVLCGSIFNVKQVGGICGALLTNLSAWLSGVWFDIELIGGGFSKIANLLPFVHAVELQRAVISGNYDQILTRTYPVLVYAAVTMLGAVLLFLRQMKRQ